MRNEGQKDWPKRIQRDYNRRYSGVMAVTHQQAQESSRKFSSVPQVAGRDVEAINAT
jgi:hypothetical protein